MITRDMIIDYYKYFYTRIHNSQFRFNLTEKISNAIDKFLEILESKHTDVGPKFLWNYFIFHFQFWEGREIKSFNGKVNFNNIIGKTPYERFSKRKKEYDWTFATAPIIRKYGLSFLEFDGLFKIKEQVAINNNVVPQVYIDVDSRIRARCNNTEEGMMECMTTTLMHQPTDPFCQKCVFAEQCQKKQKEIYPKIYYFRNR